jgi:hypothetical protein
LDLSSVVDFAKQAQEEIGKFKFDVILSPDKLQTSEYVLGTLNWDSILYNNADELNKVPDDKRGLYAFAIRHPSLVLPPHGYILYIGIAGRNSKRPLRARYKEYLNAKRILKRQRIARMIGTWHEVLRFYFAPVDDNVSTEELQELEKQLNTALMPTFSEGDLEADAKRKRRAFK